MIPAIAYGKGLTGGNCRGLSVELHEETTASKINYLSYFEPTRPTNSVNDLKQKSVLYLWTIHIILKNIRVYSMYWVNYGTNGLVFFHLFNILIFVV